MSKQISIIALVGISIAFIISLYEAFSISRGLLPFVHRICLYGPLLAFFLSYYVDLRGSEVFTITDEEK